MNFWILQCKGQVRNTSFFGLLKFIWVLLIKLNYISALFCSADEVPKKRQNSFSSHIVGFVDMILFL